MPPPSFMDSIDATASHVTRMILFNHIKTGDPIVDAFLTTLILGCFSWLVTLLYDSGIDRYFNNFSLKFTMTNIKWFILYKFFYFIIRKLINYYFF